MLLPSPRSIAFLCLLALACGRDFSLPAAPDPGEAIELHAFSVAPERARAGQVVALEFEVTRPLAAAPEAPGPNPRVLLAGVPMDCAAAGPLAWRCEVEIDETRFSDGRQEFLLQVTAEGGRTGPEVRAPVTVWLDFEAPRLIVSARPDPAAPGEDVVFQVQSIGEALSEMPTITADFVSGVPECVGSLPGTSFTCADRVAADAELGLRSFDVAGEDLAGNVGVGNGAVTLREPAPRLDLTAISPQPARPGVEVRITVSSDVHLERCDGDVGGQVAPCEVDAEGRGAVCSFLVPENHVEGNFSVRVDCRNPAGSGGVAGALRIDAARPWLDARAVALELDAAEARLLGASGAVGDTLGLPYEGRAVTAVEVWSGDTLVSTATPAADGAFALSLPPEVAGRLDLVLLARDLVGNLSEPKGPGIVRLWLTPSGLPFPTSVTPSVRLETAVVDGDPATTSPDLVRHLGDDAADPGAADLADAREIVSTAVAERRSHHGWRRIVTSTAPSPREWAAMAYDPHRRRVVLFGGHDGSGPLADTWEYDGADWSRVDTAIAPEARSRHAMTYDHVGRRVLLVGGTGALGQPGGVWAYDGHDWTLLATADEPTPRAGHAMASEPYAGTVAVVGGLGDGVPLDETVLREADGDWSSPTGSDLPTGRHDVAFVFDQVRRSYLAFGGTDGQSELGDTRSLDFARIDPWLPLEVTQAPSPRWGASLVYDTARREALLFGGVSAAGPQEDLWAFGGGDWHPVSLAYPAPGPGPRPGHRMVFDAHRSVAVLFGGSLYDADTWELERSDARPRSPVHMLSVSIPGGLLGMPLTRVGVVHAGSGSGEADADGVPDPGVTLYFWNRDRWRAVASGAEAEVTGWAPGHPQSYDAVALDQWEGVVLAAPSAGASLVEGRADAILRTDRLAMIVEYQLPSD